MSHQEDFVEHLLVVIVLFKQSLEECSAFRSLSMAFANSSARPPILAFDNSPQSLPPSVVGWPIHYITVPENVGVAKAYNTASVYALQHRLDWLLLLDQDTTLPRDFLMQYRDSVLAYPNQYFFVPIVHDRRGILSPFRVYQGTGRRIRNMAQGIYPLKPFSVINSGILISTTLFNSTGGFDERLPLDFSDIVFVSKLKQYQDQLVVINLHLYQDFSGSSITNAAASLERFRQYLSGVQVMRSAYGVGRRLLFHAFLRSIKLTLQYHDWRFIFAAIRTL